MIRKFKVTFSDGIPAAVYAVSITHTYAGVIEMSCLSAGTRHYLAEYEERRDLIEAGRLKGHYCFEPELIDEVLWELVFKEGGSVEDAEWVSHVKGKCFKDNKVCVSLSVEAMDKRHGYLGDYLITLEWYQSTRELMESPLPELIQQMAGRLEFEAIKGFCKFESWEECEGMR